MNITLPPRLEAMVAQKVESGLYNSPSEVMLEALRLLDARDRLQALRLEELRAEIRKGIDSGPSVPLDMEGIKARARAKLLSRPGE